MTSAKEPIGRKTVYRITFTFSTIDGSSNTGTKWFDDILDIPVKYFSKTNAQLWERSFDVFKKPSLEELIECSKTGNKFWLNTNEVIRKIN